MCAPTCNFQKSKHTHTHTHTRTHFLVCSISKQRSPHRQLLTFFLFFLCVYYFLCPLLFGISKERSPHKQRWRANVLFRCRLCVACVLCACVSYFSYGVL